MIEYKHSLTKIRTGIFIGVRRILRAVKISVDINPDPWLKAGHIKYRMTKQTSNHFSGKRLFLTPGILSLAFAGAYCTDFTTCCNYCLATECSLGLRRTPMQTHLVQLIEEDVVMLELQFWELLHSDMLPPEGAAVLWTGNVFPIGDDNSKR